MDLIAARGRAFASLRDALPSGKTLPPEIWQRRHRTMVVLLWMHVVGLPLYGLARGYTVVHILDVVPIAVFGAAALIRSRSMRFRACMVAFGLLSSSAALVHLSGGAIEAHFHFFVMVTILACYEEWTPYLLAILFVLIHHGLGGALMPEAVYSHASAVEDPWKWAGIHALFIAGLCIVNVISWRMNEDARAARASALARLEYQAHHDVLTGLPNRIEFTRRLSDRLARARRGAGHVAVCFIDLDNFKVINDSLGHDAGDRLLRLAADRLAEALRPSDVVGRFGGDEFTVLLSDVADEADARRVSERLVDVLRPPFVLDGEQRYLTASVGLTVTGDPGTEPEDMLREADMAMYRAKELGKSQCALFDDWLRERSVERLDLEGGLRHAVAREELRLVYQPEVSLATGSIVAVEALLRWDHPTHGVVSPVKFIPIAEQSGLIVPIGAWVVREACRTAAGWRRETGIEDLTIAVNLSPRQLGAVDLVDTVREALEETGLPPACLCLEVTETALMADMDTALVALERLKALGVQLAVDDFGIGYSSLMHLKQLLPVDVLKIDKSFVDGVISRPADRAIVEAVVSLAGALGVSAIAEGVESADQADVLRGLSCGFAQGFHFARPSDPEHVLELLAAQAETTA